MCNGRRGPFLTPPHLCDHTDDTVIYTDYTKTDIENAGFDLQVDLKNLNNWCKMNEICIYIGISKSMAFGTSYQVNHCDPPNVSLGNIDLELLLTIHISGHLC